MRITSSLLVGTLFLCNFVSKISANPAVETASKINQAVKSQLDKSPTVDIIVSFKVGTASVLQKFSNEILTPVNRLNRIEALVSSLQNHTQISQQNVLEFLTKSKKSSVKVQSFWISNQIVVKNSDADLVFGLSKLDNVEKIDLNLAFGLDDPLNAQSVPRPTENAWGVENIEAPKVWNLESNGTGGEGAIVGIIDTGARLTHEAIAANYLGVYGWFDPYSRTSQPNDQDGHGTHVTGTIAGKFGIGVAPNAKWIHCKGADADSNFHLDSVLACGEFMMCPTLPTGLSPDCSKAPHIVSNSWGGGTEFFTSVVEAWRKAGIIPVFAIGNSGPSCSTTGSPGDLANVIGVGATTIDNGLAEFSSRGPSKYGEIKPDVSAPGVAVVSASHTSDTEYIAFSGTSMACPHVAGVLALLKSHDPNLTFEKAKDFLIKGIQTNLKSTGDTCDGKSDSQFPNHFYGHGKVNAYRSYTELLLNGGTALQATIFRASTISLIVASIYLIF